MQAIHKNFWLALFSLLALRVIVGLHFYNEGVTKLQDERFSSAPFLRQARGPLADHFTGLLDDSDGRLRLCLTPWSAAAGFGDPEIASPDSAEEEDSRFVIDTTPTFAIWEDFVEQATTRFRLDADQSRQANVVLKNSKRYLSDFLDANETEILAWASGRSRLDGFARDGENRQATATGVASLNDQLGSIRADRNKAAAAWFGEVESTWDELEARINRIGGVDSGESYLTISRPYRQPGSWQDLIDRFLPWFDTITGGLLILGLFTRLASLGGMLLLLGVVMTQPFWVPGTQNTFYQWIELASLLVLFATAAGQFGGLDYFIGRRKRAARGIEDE